MVKNVPAAIFEQEKVAAADEISFAFVFGGLLKHLFIG